MSGEGLQGFAENLHQEILVLAEGEENQALTPDVFTSMTLDVLQEAGEVEDATACYHRDHGIEVSGYGIDDDETLNLFNTIYRGQLPPGSVTQTDVETAFRRLVRFWERCRDGEYALDLEESSDQFDMVLRIGRAARDIGRLRLFLLTDGISRVEFRPERLEDGLTITQSIWDIQRLQRCMTSGMRRDPIEIDFVERFGLPIPCLGADEPGADYVCYLAVFPGDVLAELYGEFGPRLLELNVRSFLQARGKVNRGIRDTIVNQPERFLAYNNGIAATASEVEISRGPDGVPGIARMRDLQIVNGGQTTASLHAAVRRDKADLSEVFVQAKISVVARERLDDIVPLISRFANSQNRVTEADLSSNDPFHVRIEELSRTIWAPATERTERQTRWFYERARGQYADALSREATPARQRSFKQQNPAQQRFTKTDLAKFENTWAQLPHEVSKGAQKSFVAFMQRLATGGRVIPDQSYFHNLVAKAIMFRRTERIVHDQQFGGYRANIVTYTLALISRATAQRVDLGRIWREQDLTSALTVVIAETSRMVYEVISDPPGGANVTEYCKQAACWTRVRELTPRLPPALEGELLQLGPPRPSSNGGESTRPEDLAAIEEVAKVESDRWFAISNWAKETRNLEPWQRALAFSLGRLSSQGRQPSVKQAKHGLRILEEAETLGFHA